MAFPKKLLNTGERLVVDIHPHWWYFAKQALALVVSIGLLIFFRTKDWDVPTLLMAALTLVSLLWFVGRYLKWMTTNFAVTSHRVIFREGVIAKKGIEIPLDRVNTIFFNQGILERMLRTGDLTIESAGERGTQSFSDIRRPSQVQNEIYRLIEEEQDEHASASRELSVPEQLEKLDELRRRGIIDEAEFKAKKTKLLERM
ncbi:MAG TPA: PH domain-containing protein [Acidimicrobiales bacterium]|nr:PH domain-containing protein [Acidimicrobiales bacterium]